MKASNLAKLLTTVFLAGAMVFTAEAAFSKVKTYNGSFSDVAKDAWYAKEVASAYELGFVDGVSDTSFSPDTTVTVAQGITMACRVHAAYNGGAVEQVSGGNWYDMYVNYAKKNGIIDENQFESYTRELKRHEMAELFYDAMPDGYFNAINDVDYIPDIPMGAMYQDKLLTLYNAGIVMGSDEYGTFNPTANIKRSECAAIINRVAIPENRVKGELEDLAGKDAYTLCYNTSMEGNKEGINSGWVLDNRGGVAKTSNAGFGTIIDVNEKYATAWIREFNYIPSGTIVLETNVSTYKNGSFVEYRDVKGETVYMIKIVDGYWSVLGKDGKYTAVAKNNKASDDNTSFDIRAYIDLDDGKSTTYINGEACGSFDLLSDNVLSCRIGIDEKGTGSITMAHVNMVVNYNVYEDFTFYGAEKVYGWEVTGNTDIKSKQLNITEGSAAKSFEEANGNVCTETYFYSKNGDDFEIAIGNVLTVKSVGKKLFAGDTELYTLTPDMWYRLRVEADTVKGTATVYLNGQKKGEVKLAKNEGISKLSFSTKGGLSVDFVKVYVLYEHEDYVPVPSTKASMDDYIIGLNICSLWRNGTHYGWHCITPFDEPTPVLGYYDEGVPETADWEIKFMVEHGIDFQAFCWYSDVKMGPLKEPRNGEQLHNGYQYAKYSDYMKYCLLFEVANGAHFDSQQFRNYVIPFWFENYFLDDRYMTIDNKLVLGMFSPSTLFDKSYFGSIANVKAEFDYLESVAKSHGFDGVLYFCNGDASDNFANMGMDSVFAYNWGTAGSSLQTNKDRILRSAKYQKLYTIPTISVGFDSIPWHQLRYDLMSVEDFAAGMEWVKKEYLPSYSGKHDWADKLVWISTWNEYGEGTYISPAGLNGFGYLDVLRGAFTNLPENHTDHVPTLKQAERINHLYPQYARLLRRDGWYTFNATKEDKAKELKNKLYINDQDVLGSSAHEIPPMLKDGKVYFPFEPVTAVNFIMNMHYEWRKNAGTLLIEANGHTVKMLVGSDRYLKDGKEYDLGYKLELFDNIPMLDYVKLCADLEYKCEEKDGNLYIYTDNYDIVWKDLSNRKTGVWEFNSVDTEGWASGHMSLETNNGALKMTTITDSKDPIMTFRSNNFPDNFYTHKFTSFEIKYRYKHDGSGQTISIYYITDVDSTWSENKCMKIRLDGSDSNGEWKTAKYNLADVANWQTADRLTGLRFDPFNAHGEMEIDYFRFIEDPEFVYVPLDERPLELLNGNAEGNVVSYFSDNAKIQKIADPFKEGNHVWFVETKPGKNWTYFRHKARYKEGATYKVDFDIKLVGNNADDPSVLSSSYCVNYRFADSSAGGKIDHLTAQNTKLSIKDGWVHCSTEFTTNNIDNNDKSEFAIYVNPAGDVSFDYYIDNLVVREVGGAYEEEAEIVINENTEGSIVLPVAKPEEEVKDPVKLGVISVNGDAEGEIVSFYSGNAEISIVEDPDKAGNKVWSVKTKGTPDYLCWTYFRFKYDDIRPGVTYKISYDIKFAGNSNNDASVNEAVFHTNVVYKEEGALNGSDHPISAQKFAKGDWVHCEVEYIPGDVTDNEISNFAIYVDPVGDASISYYIDNYKVEIVKA